MTKKNPNALAPDHWIWSKFDELNAQHFRGQLEPPQEILRLQSTTWAALTVNTMANGTPCRLIWLDGEALDTDPSVAADSLLHEMVHYELAAQANGDGDQTHGTRFVVRADEIGRSLGLPSCCLPGFTAEQHLQIARIWPKVQRQAVQITSAK